jgi:hypothetical protein
MAQARAISAFSARRKVDGSRVDLILYEMTGPPVGRQAFFIQEGSLSDMEKKARAFGIALVGPSMPNEIEEEVLSYFNSGSSLSIAVRRWVKAWPRHLWKR